MWRIPFLIYCVLAWEVGLLAPLLAINLLMIGFVVCLRWHEKRAERRIGELMADERRADKLSKGGRPSKTTLSKSAVSLKSQGIDNNLADRARELFPWKHS